MKILKLLPAIALLTTSFASIECSEDQEVFSIRNWIEVPDGTLVAPFFNPKDCTSHLPWDLIDEVSIAAGEIRKETMIHTMPLVTQIVFVLSGSLEVIIKEAKDDLPKVLHAEANEAVLTKAGSLFQLRNRGEGSCRVLYIVSPAYLFEMDEAGSVVYDDAFIVKESWEQLKQQRWKPFQLPSLESLRTAREESYLRLQSLKRGQ
ncbi:MAG: hypothetical protein JSR39_07125 [Verrucomicrobia bacterium]|nr:hypothetical protein [Verrucomicrobiota bacterium]